MTQLPKDAIDQIEKTLREELARVAARIAELSGQDPFRDPERANDNAATDLEASEESNHDRVSALVSELTHQKTQVEHALTRIADGSYGVCQVCSMPIDAGRLHIMPTATLCLTHEKEQSQQKTPIRS